MISKRSFLYISIMKTLLSFSFFILSFSVFAQKSDSTRMRYRIIRGGLIEHSTTLKSNRYVKNGWAEIKSGRDLLATGVYKDGERYGRWRFFRGPDSLEQVYNYTSRKLEYNNPPEQVSYKIDDLKEGDVIKYPAKIGGYFTSLHFLIRKFSPPMEFKAYPGIHTVLIIFHIDEHGKLVKYETETGKGTYLKKDSLNLKKFRSEDLEFVPAYRNDKPVSSKLIYQGKLTVN